MPFLWNIVFTVLSHGIGTAWQAGLIFNHPSAQVNPWIWSLIHGLAVLLACVAVVIFWRTTEDEQHKSMRLATQLADTELGQRKFTSELLVNLARRNQSMLYRQLDIINQLEEKERNPDTLGDLFRLDHLATRIRRNAESLLVLSGEEAPRIWSEPVGLIDVVRAAIAETEHLNRVTFSMDEHDERLAVLGHTVTDLTHVLAELTENAVRFSPPEAKVTIRTRPGVRTPGEAVVTIEDWGVGMRPEDLAHANDLLAAPRDIAWQPPGGSGCTSWRGSRPATASRPRSPPPQVLASRRWSRCPRNCSPTAWNWRKRQQARVTGSRRRPRCPGKRRSRPRSRSRGTPRRALGISDPAGISDPTRTGPAGGRRPGCRRWRRPAGRTFRPQRPPRCTRPPRRRGPRWHCRPPIPRSTAGCRRPA